MKHAVVLDYNRCRGCTTCIKSCPTEAIRVRRGKALILADRCIDCGNCIRACPHHAMKSLSDKLDILKNYVWRCPRRSCTVSFRTWMISTLF